MECWYEIMVRELICIQFMSTDFYLRMHEGEVIVHLDFKTL